MFNDLVQIGGVVPDPKVGSNTMAVFQMVHYQN